MLNDGNQAARVGLLKPDIGLHWPIRYCIRDQPVIISHFTVAMDNLRPVDIYSSRPTGQWHTGIYKGMYFRWTAISRPSELTFHNLAPSSWVHVRTIACSLLQRGDAITRYRHACTVSIVYKVTGCNDIPAIMIELVKIKSGSKPYQMYREISHIMIKSEDHKTSVLPIKFTSSKTDPVLPGCTWQQT